MPRGRKSLFTLPPFLAFLIALSFGTSLLGHPRKADIKAGFKEFSGKIGDYMKVHKMAENGLPGLKAKDKPEAIAAYQDGLIKNLRALRGDARQGAIFTPLAAQAFKREIKHEMSKPDVRRVQNTIDAGNPLKGFAVQVNQIYPEGLPFTTVPPTLLLKLPRLPDAVGYRILGSDLLLVDINARLIVDFLPGALMPAGN